MENLLLYDSCEELSRKFYSLKTPQDVATLLNIEYKTLVYHLYKSSEDSKYILFEIPKKTGGTRTISAPITALKILQRKLSQVLYSIYKVKACVHGFSPEKSIVTNARAHKRKEWILNIDLDGFFPSINFGRVRGMFMSAPYNCNPKVATTLAQICCHNNQLPQGAPTSPIVSNMICARMDSQLTLFAKSIRCIYTRYADDITFSTRLTQISSQLVYCITNENDEEVVLGNELISIINSNGFNINVKKTRLQNKRMHQEVTGLTVNQFPNLKRKYIRQVRAMLHAWEEYGSEAVEKRYLEKYACRIQHPDKATPSFKEVLRGRIEFIAVVRGKNDFLYKRYLAWYQKLIKR